VKNEEEEVLRKLKIESCKKNKIAFGYPPESEE